MRRAGVAVRHATTIAPPRWRARTSRGRGTGRGGLGLAASAWAAFVLRELARRDEVRGLDLPGGALFVVGLTGLVLGISRGGLYG